MNLSARQTLPSSWFPRAVSDALLIDGFPKGELTSPFGRHRAEIPVVVQDAKVLIEGRKGLRSALCSMGFRGEPKSPLIAMQRRHVAP